MTRPFQDTLSKRNADERLMLEVMAEEWLTTKSEVVRLAIRLLWGLNKSGRIRRNYRGVDLYHKKRTRLKLKIKLGKR